jgi:DNA-binding beta-propeller fold protein YncE
MDMRAFVRFLLASMAAAMVPGLAGAAPPLPALYVANAGNNTVEVYQPPSGAGTLFDSAGLSLPYGLAFDSLGNLYVTNGISGTIEKITPSGVATVFASGLHEPTGLAFDSLGNLYVANYSTYAISKITPGGTVSLFATLSFDAGPFGLAFDGSGNLYVALSVTNAIDKITPSKAVSTFASGNPLNMPYGIAFNTAGTLLYVADYENGEIVDYTLGGTGSSVMNLGVGTAPAGLAFDGSGDLYVSDSVDNTIDEITGLGSNPKETLFTNTGLNAPYGLAYQPAAQSVPEPASTGLFGIAFLALGVLRGRWRFGAA